MYPDLLAICPLNALSVNQEALLPGSKSITNRALLFAALARGTTVLTGGLESEDTTLMIECLCRLGVIIDFEPDGSWQVHGVGGTFPISDVSLDVGTAGTVARLLVGMLAIQPRGSFRIDGSEVMRRRPMRELTSALTQIGCRFVWEGEPGALPFVMHPSGFANTELQVDASATSQVLSSILMAAAYAPRSVSIRMVANRVRKPYVLMTSRMMASFSGPEVCWKEDFSEFEVINPAGYAAVTGGYLIESDASAASYFLTLPRVVGGALRVRPMVLDSLQGDVAYLQVLKLLGAEWQPYRDGLSISFPGKFRHPLCWNFYDISDTFMTLAAVAPLLERPVRIEGIAHTRKQESNRVHAMALELQKLGQEVEEGNDFLEIRGNLNALREVARAGVEIETYKDHRIAMSFGILGCKDLLGDRSPWMSIRDPGCCAKTFPEFFLLLDRMGRPE